MSHCVITFDRHMYIAGEDITGRVVITNSKSIKIRDISLVIKGSGKVEWSESESYTENGESKTRTITYSSHEQYLNSRTILYGQMDGPTIQLPPGSHSFDFKCHLPPELPGSMYGKHGSIEYKAKVNFDIPWSFDDNYNKTFKVVPRVDLNCNPEWNIPVQNERIKQYCTWKCTTKPAIITVTLPKTGYVVDEKIPISIHISNLSHVSMLTAKAVLERTIYFKAHTPRHKERSDETELTLKRYDLYEKANDRIIQVNGSLNVPHTEITCNRSGIIRIKYHVEVSIYVSGCHNTTKIYIPVVIGSIPMDSARNTVLLQQSPHAPLAPMPTIPPLPMPIPQPSPRLMPTKEPSAPVSDEAAPPPSYSEAVYGWKPIGEGGQK